MALGLPSVATRITGVPEMVEHGVNGLLVDPYDPKTLEVALRRILDDPKLGERYVAAGLERTGRFDRETTFSRVEAILRESARR